MNPIKPPQVPGSYHDFAGLGALRGQAGRDQRQAARETAVQFEAFFIQQMLKTMREAVIKGELVESNAADTYQDMMDKEVSLSIARGRGLGLASMLEREMLKSGVASTQDVLKARSGAGLPLHTEPVPLPAPGQAPGLPLPQRAPLHWSHPLDAHRPGVKP